MSDASNLKNENSPRRAARPERIDLGDDVCVRNDILASALGCCEKTLNRDDANGAPYLYVAGVKYRPERGFREFIAAKIQTRGQPAKGRGRHR